MSLDGLGDLLRLIVGDCGFVGCTMPSFFGAAGELDVPAAGLLEVVAPLMLLNKAGKLVAVAM